MIGNSETCAACKCKRHCEDFVMPNSTRCKCNFMDYPQETLEKNPEDFQMKKEQNHQTKRSSRHRKHLRQVIAEMDADRDSDVKQWENELLYEQHHE